MPMWRPRPMSSDGATGMFGLRTLIDRRRASRRVRLPERLTAAGPFGHCHVIRIDRQRDSHTAHCGAASPPKVTMTLVVPVIVVVCTSGP